ncbi:MAG: LamG-like jellyroll fold domain-containing protein, partial [Candidatus Thorarchaeota archaeon SMTZ1-83]
SNGPQFGVEATTPLMDTEWRHVVFVFDESSAGASTVYVDGVDDKSTTYGDINGIDTFQTGSNFRLNGRSSPSGDYMFDGMLDEVRISRVARSSDWILTEFSNQNDPSTFYSIGTEESFGETVQFDYKKDITIDHNQVSGDLTDFPVLIELYDSDLRTDVQPDGDDIIFKSGGSILAHEIEIFEQSHNASHAHLVAWVKADLLSSTDTVITMYYGNPSIENQEDSAGVWGSKYVGVWHLSEDPTGTLYDSTSNLNHGEGYNLQSEDQVDGQIDGSIDFDNTQDYIHCGNDTSLNVGSNDFSLSLWFKYDGVDMGVLAGKGAVLMAKRYRISIESGPGLLMAEIDDNTVAKTIFATSTYGDNLWHHVSMVRDGNNLRLYIDGAEDPNSPIDITGYGSLDESESFYIGAFRSEVGGTIGYWSTANTDEVRVAKLALSPEWIATEHSNQDNPAGFYSFGAETSVQTIEFEYTKDIVVDHTKVDAYLQDFPLLVNIYDTDLRVDVQADGGDIMFKSDTAVLPHEIELFDQNYNSTHAHLVAWVKTNLSSTDDTRLMMYYGNPQAPNQESPTEVWNQDYMGVWHLGETAGGSGAIKDSTTNVNHGTDAGNPTFGISGPIGNAMLFDGTDDTINCGNGPSLTIAGNTMTIEAWAFLSEDTAPQWGSGIAQKDMSYALFQDWDASRRFSFEMNADSRTWVSDTNKDMYRWYHVVGVYDGVSTYIYVDGVQRGFFDNTGPIDATASSLNIGRGDQYFDGRIDEVRVLNVSKSVEWILAEFRNQNDPSSFYSLGAEVPAQTGSIDTTGFQFTTNSTSAITIGVRVSQTVTKSGWSYADDHSLGTTFSVSNGSIATWTANVMVSPPPEIEAVRIKISYPEGEWIPTQVISPSGAEKALNSDWSCFGGTVTISSNAVNEYGSWKIKFQDNNHVLDTLVGPSGGPFSPNGVFSVGQDIAFQFWCSGVPGSTMSLKLVDPTGSTWYSGTASFQGERFAFPYSHRKDLTIDHTLVTSNLIDFPVLIDIYDTDLRTEARSDGKDIAFACGDTALSHEIELFDQSFNSTHAHLIAWVKVPLLSASVDTIVTMYYDNPTVPIVEDPAGVWDLGYLGVWHLSESGDGSPGEYEDSSLYKHHGQGGEGDPLYVPQVASGKIGSAQYFTNETDGKYDLIDCGDSPLWDISGTQITMEAWVWHNNTPWDHVYGIMNHKGWSDGYSLFMRRNMQKVAFNLPGESHQLTSATDITVDNWHHIVAVYDGSTMRTYIDGVQDPNVMDKNQNIEPSSAEKGFWIGHADQPKDVVWSGEWVGFIDEVRLSTVSRSEAWIETEFRNQNNPGGFYAVGAEETIGYSLSENITLDGTAQEGVWYITAQYTDDGSSDLHKAGTFTRSFVVTHGTSFSLLAPSDAVSDDTAARLIGEQLYVEFELQDTLDSGLVSGASVTMNWSVSGTPTSVQLNDYGDGRYGGVYDTSDLGTAGRWQLDLNSYHSHYTNATYSFYLDLSHETYLTYKPPTDVAYGDNFVVKLTLRDAFDDSPQPSATFSCNGTIVGVPVDYGNGTYLVTIDSDCLAVGEYAFRLMATPSDSYLLSSSIDVKFSYRSIATEAYPSSADPVELSWGQEASITLHWIDIDHSGIGVNGGSISIDPSIPIQTSPSGDGTYSVTIDVSSYSPGTHAFDLTVSKANYQAGTTSIVIIVKAHSTSVGVNCNTTVPVGTDSYFELTFLDLDSGSIPIGSGNFSQVILDWGTGNQAYSSLEFWLDTSTWAVGFHTINITVYATTGPRYYIDSSVSIELVVRRLGVYLSWEHLEPFPNGNDFEIFVHVNISEPNAPLDGDPITGLDISYFSAKNETGDFYTFESFTELGNGRYSITIDNTRFYEGNYGIIVIVDFLPSENFTDTQTPTIAFSYRPILTHLSSSDYPTVTTTYDTNVTVTLNYVDIDNSQNITTGIITAEGASIDWVHIANGEYRVVIIVQGWDLGTHEVNLTADATSYQAKTLTFQILVQIAHAYARSSISSIDLPVGDTAVFFADYWDITKDEPIVGASVSHNWLHSLNVVWTGSDYRIELPSLDSDILGSYLIMFNFSKGVNYQFGYFNVSVTLRTHYTEFRLASAVEPTGYKGKVNVSVYYRDLDNNVGIVSPFINVSVYGEAGWISSTLENDTGLGDGYYVVRIAASDLGVSGIFNFTINFNWTGPVQKYYDRVIRASVNIIGEASSLTLEEFPGSTPYLENMSYSYFYSELYSGAGISNSSVPAGNVLIRVDFLETAIDPALISISEPDPVGSPGHYKVEFNSTSFGRPGVYTMRVYVNWSKNVEPFYANRTDTISVRIISRSTLLSVTPPESTAYGVNATFSFSFDDVANGTAQKVADSAQMTVTVGLSDYTLTYDSISRLFHVSFNTSILGEPLGGRQFNLGVTWVGTPFYANITNRIVLVTVTQRETSFDYSAPVPTQYGEKVSIAVSFIDTTGGSSKPINDASIILYNATQEIPALYYDYSLVGAGLYSIDLNTTYFEKPSLYSLVVEVSTPHFFYANATGSRTLNVMYRLTTLLAEPVGTVSYNSSLNLVFRYQDILSSTQIGNGSTPTTIQILNASWSFMSSTWRDATHDYLVVVETHDQGLDINTDYVLWLRFGYPDSSPYYLPAETFVTFRLRQRSTTLNLADPPLPTPSPEHINLTTIFQDAESGSGIDGATISLAVGGTGLVEGTDYHLQTSIGGFYYLSVNSTVVGAAGSSALLRIDALWPSVAPYYADSTVSITLYVVERSASVRILTQPSQVCYLENISYVFAYVDEMTEGLISVAKDQVRVYSGGTLLASSDFSMSCDVVGYRVSINSTKLSSGLVSSWNVTTYVDWQYDIAPYYTDSSAQVRVTVVNRRGSVSRGEVPTVPLGDNMTLTFSYLDDANGVGIGNAMVEFDSLNSSGLVENTDYWVSRGTGENQGDYGITVDASRLSSTGVYTFTLRLLWNPSAEPYYQNTTLVYLYGSVRLIQAQLVNDAP